MAGESGKLYGNPLNIGVRTQLLYRAQNLAAKDKDVQQLMVDNNRGAWVTLASSAQTLPEETIKYKETLKQHIKSPHEENERLAQKYLEQLEASKSTMGNQLAQGNVLSGGTLYGKVTDENKLVFERRTGINFSERYNPFSNQSSYEHSPEFGFQPMMGITDFKVNTQSAFGSLRKATVTIKAFTPEQLSILETLYFRPGFTMLLEWGNSAYFDKNGEISSFNLGVAKTFTAGNLKEKEEEIDGEKVKISAIQQIKDMMKGKRELSGYNYDGMIGKVVNFSWKLANDQSYDCTLDILSEGMVVDAVKTVFVPTTSTSLDKYKDSGQAETSGTDDDLLIDALEIFKNKDKRKEYIENEYPGSKIRVYYGDSFQVESESEEDGAAQYNNDRFYYLTLRDFCYVFNKQILEKQNTGNIKVRFSTKFNRSVMTTFPGHISNDPGICVMPYRDGLPYEPNPASSNINFAREFNLYGGLQDQYGTNIYKPAPTKWKDKNFQQYSNKRVPLEAGYASKFLPADFGDEFSNDSPYKILVNIDHLILIQESFKEQANEDHEIKAVVAQFFNKLLGDINSCLGGINNLASFFDEDNNEWVIIDHNNFDLQAGTSGRDKPSSEPPLLNIIGLKTEVSKLDIQSKISNEMFNQLAITATASDQSVEESIDNFSRYNANVADRFVPFEKPAVVTNKKPSSQNWKEAKASGPKAIAKAWHRYINGLEDSKTGTHPKSYSKEAFDACKTSHRKYMNALNDQREGKTRQAGEKRPFNGGLLPIELSLTLRGIAGLKIGEAFVINDVLLPQRSRGVIGFTITGIDHSIGLNNEWLTNVTTAMYNLPDTEIPVEDEYEEPYVAPEPEPVAGPKETPNANRLRASIAAAGYREKKKSGYSTGELTSAVDATKNISGKVDITADMATYGINVINAIKKEVPNITVTFTGGNDKFHHGLSYTSRHVSGRALDFVISPYSTDAYKKVLAIIQGYAAGENDKVRFKDEYKKMTAAATGAHFHLSYGKGTEGKKELKQSVELAEQNKIGTRKFV